MKVRIKILVNADQSEWLRARAVARGCSVAQVVRDVIDACTRILEERSLDAQETKE